MTASKSKPPRRGNTSEGRIRRTGVHISAGYLYLPEDVVNNLFGKPPRYDEIPRVYVRFVPGSDSTVRRLSRSDAVWEYGLIPRFEPNNNVRIRVAKRLRVAGLPADYRQEYVSYESHPNDTFLTLFLPGKGEDNG